MPGLPENARAYRLKRLPMKRQEMNETQRRKS
jgi:hypothetical protein